VRNFVVKPVKFFFEIYKVKSEGGISVIIGYRENETGPSLCR